MTSAITPSEDLAGLYRDLHAHPELSFQEHRTAGIVADRLRAIGAEVTTGVGRTGVVGVLRNGDGPVVMLRADMDALPVAEETGLPYASTATGLAADGTEVPVMHACGHDVHVTCLLGALTELAADRSWHGTVVAVFQPAEEAGAGADAMVADGLLERFPRPSVVLGQHVSPGPAGWVLYTPGPAMAAAASLRVTLYGKGGHGSRPETTVDPIVMAAATVLRLQTVVSREVPPAETAVLTVGALHAGARENVIADKAELLISTRSFNEHTERLMHTAIERIARGEAATAGAGREPDVVREYGFPVTFNDPEATRRTAAALAKAIGDDSVHELPAVTGSEDVGILATKAGVPLVYWLLGGMDPARFQAAFLAGRIDQDLPSNHSPHFAPVIEPTLTTGVKALVGAAREWLE